MPSPVGSTPCPPSRRCAATFADGETLGPVMSRLLDLLRRTRGGAGRGEGLGLPHHG